MDYEKLYNKWFHESFKMDLRQFICIISKFQEDYFFLENELNKPEIKASEVSEIYRSKNHLAQNLVKFILNKRNKVEILNNKLLENK